MFVWKEVERFLSNAYFPLTFFNPFKTEAVII